MRDCGGLYTAIENALMRCPEADVILWKDRSYRAGELLGRAACAAAALQSRGLGSGDRVVVQAPNSLDLLLLYLAAMRLGAIYVPLNTAYTAAELAFFLEDCEPKLFVCGADRMSDLAALAAEQKVRIAALDENLLSTSNASPAAAKQMRSSDTAAIVYTSGTTGRSKGAVISHGNLISNARALVEAWGISPTDTLLHTLPLYHIHGLFVALHTALLGGARIHLMPKFDVALILQHLSDTTILMGVPTHYTRLLSDPGFDRKCVANVRLFISGSAPLSPATFDQFETRTGHRILERYGMTECGIICSNPLNGPRVAGTVGFPLRETEVRLEDQNVEAPAAERVATLEVRGPGVFSGYWRLPEKTASEFRDGWFVTGDLATIDTNGRVRIVGREKDLIISGGLNVYPKEIEVALERLEMIEESAVFGVAHPDLGEAVAAVITLKPDAGRPSEHEIINTLRTQLAGFKVPKALFVVEELPRNAMGKVQKVVLRELYGGSFA